MFIGVMEKSEMKNVRAGLSGVLRSELDQILFNALRAVYRLERYKIEAFGLTYEEIYILQFLRRGRHLSIGDIVDELRIPVSTASRIVSRMQKRGLVAKKRDGKDRRSILVSLLSQGRAIVKKVEDHTYARIMRNISTFSDAETEAFLFTAIHLGDILEGEKDGNPEKK